MDGQLSIFDTKYEKTTSKVVNVASVPQRSPFRYPGGKTWLIPVVRKWLKQSVQSKTLFEPFAGGGIVSLTAAFENLADKIVMVELDSDVSAVWEEIVNGDPTWLAEKIYSFNLTIENAKAILGKDKKTNKEKALSTIIKNRIFHGGIITKGSGLIKSGENGKGIKSRWYPKTLHDRIFAIGFVNHKMKFISGDAFEELEKIKNEKNFYSFIDPPYTVAGKRLYTHFEIDHEALFQLTSQLQGKFMLTYDNTKEIRDLASKFNLKYRTIPMKTTHHIKKDEIIIADNFDWF
ncbi:MAG: DNA adenine methylase [Prolixibacteraceae bacterium]|nr:DNA adenine methylase [Prolixibacteraceae bacterium]